MQLKKYICYRSGLDNTAGDKEQQNKKTLRLRVAILYRVSRNDLFEKMIYKQRCAIR